MIKIDKGPAPSTIPDKCEEITGEMKKIFAYLSEQFPIKQRAGGPISLDDEDYKALTELLLAGKKATKTAIASTKKRLKPVVFGVEVKAELRTGFKLTESNITSLSAQWEAKLAPLAASYNLICANIAAAWEPYVSGFLKRDLTEALNVARSFYQVKALETGRPFRTAKEAANPRWFSGKELLTWTDAFPSMPPSLIAALFATWQQLINDFSEECKKHGLQKLLPVLWMLGDPRAPPAKEALFGVASTVYIYRLRNALPLDLSLTPQEVSDMKNQPEVIRNTLAWCFLSVRAYGEALDDALAPAREKNTYPLIGFASDAFSSEYYSGHGIKEALMNTHHGKCAFCEAKVRHIAHGDVEHFRPKAGYEQGYTFNRSGYFWEAYNWDNLFYSCQTCNQIYKGNKFPVLLEGGVGVETRRTHERGAAAERPVLIDPGADEPRDHIRFNPMTAEAYPYDLVAAYCRSKGVTDPQAHFWADPKEIPPFVVDYKVRVDPKTQTFVVSGAGNDLWNNLHTLPPETMRGLRTIQILGLNRKELVLQRAAHLRGLRGLFWAAWQDTAETAAARAAIDAARTPSAEFSSLAIDAIGTWALELARVTHSVSMRSSNPFSLIAVVDPWIERYSAILAAPPTYVDEKKIDFEDSDSIMFLITPDQLRGGDRERMLVYMTKDEELDEDDPPGWYVAVSAEDYELNVSVFTPRGKLVEELTIGELLELSQPWRKFKDKKLKVNGPFKETFGTG